MPVQYTVTFAAPEESYVVRSNDGGVSSFTSVLSGGMSSYPSVYKAGMFAFRDGSVVCSTG